METQGEGELRKKVKVNVSNNSVSTPSSSSFLEFLRLLRWIHTVRLMMVVALRLKTVCCVDIDHICACGDERVGRFEQEIIKK